jgi:hypothetical protein
MKLPVAILLPAFAGSVFLTGCVNPPAAPSAAAPAKAPAPVAAKAPAAPMGKLPEIATAPAVSGPLVPLPAPVLSNEASDVVARLTQTVGTDTLPHEISENSSFPEAMATLQPGAKPPKFEFIDARALPPVQGLTADGNSTALIVRDWTGLVLVPINTSLSKAYTSAVRLLKVEAHPLKDGRVRIWIRVQNVGQQDLSSEIACSFRMRNDGAVSSPNFYDLEVPARGFRDVFFISPEGQLTTYTVLVRQPH